MNLRPSKIAPLLFMSGLCALVYQIAWLRELRLIFGASTAASAAVVAIFIGGLGMGGWLIGHRADRHPAPLSLYAGLETLIALSAAATPGLLWLARAAYVGVGGTLALGLAAGTIVRLLLAALVLAVPTWLMGGTLPAAARSVTTDEDGGRRTVALLYGLNTLGAVTGCFLANFFMLEVFGTRATLWLACLVNLIVAMAARRMAAGLAPAPASKPAAEGQAAGAPARFVLAASAIVGFAFFLMELVWYRMLAPILGGSGFTFGLILAVALVGIGLGGLAYAFFRGDEPATLPVFAWTCLIEATCIAFPYALGDRVAILALILRPLGSVGMFWGQVLGWTLVSFLVVLPAAFVAGFQFPVLISLLGRGREGVGHQIGLAYAWNTVGAIIGALAGGFGAVPLLTAPGAWRATALGLAALGVAALLLTVKERGLRLAWAPALIAASVAALCSATGPTAAWRHSGIGVGRGPSAFRSPSELKEWQEHERRVVLWDADGVESSVALAVHGPGLSFVVNGKVDGNSRYDASTMVMSGLIGAAFHPQAKRSLVIGLGTGATAGWLAAVPSMQQTDVVELEPRVLDVARACALVNHGVMTNPKVQIAIGDARESLLVSRDRYDLVFSEPSNPYRAGIASLFTREYYEAVAERLDKGGLFLQWVQAYEVDGRTVRTIYKTLASVFPHIETWQVGQPDLLLVASRDPIAHDAELLRARLREEPYRSAAFLTWRVSDLEGFLSYFLARESFARFLATGLAATPLNTDDLNAVEFGFARTVGRQGLFSIGELRDLARARHEDRIEFGSASVDWNRVEDDRVALYARPGEAPFLERSFREDQRLLATAFTRRAGGDWKGALAAFRAVGREPRNPIEREVVAMGLAEAGDEAALPYIDRWRDDMPLEADAALARLRTRQGRFDEAVPPLVAALVTHRNNPWPLAQLVPAALDLVVELAVRSPSHTATLLGAVQQPFATHAHDEDRVGAAAELVSRLDLPALCSELLAPLEPHFPWSEKWLALRVDCYAARKSPLLERARADLAEFRRYERVPFGVSMGLPLR